ncbi:hypothetical protein [Clostridium psychrophilum]|uniref:hypothetical protein n=1 Tax=Clostridium psychrophilum TaxID=132926 RepID=UPI001C0BDA82|nr:hypothetical protein [Clostridium psychrophilum]MBU3180380.1 hypothetical protein [Clostridium psychrophilum]
MRVFQLEKNNEHYVGHKNFNMKIEEANKINCIVINNPAQSNCLCVINHLVCKSIESKNIVHLIISNDDKQLKDTTTFGSLTIGYEYASVEAHDNLEIDIVNIEKNSDVDMLDEHFLIILPGGNIHIKLEEPQKKIILQISVGQQMI